MIGSNRILDLTCPYCDARLRRVISKPPTFTERAECETCQIIWLFEINDNTRTVTAYDESGLVAPQSLSLEDV